MDYGSRLSNVPNRKMEVYAKYTNKIMEYRLPYELRLCNKPKFFIPISSQLDCENL